MSLFFDKEGKPTEYLFKRIKPLIEHALVLEAVIDLWSVTYHNEVINTGMEVGEGDKPKSGRGIDTFRKAGKTVQAENKGKKENIKKFNQVVRDAFIQSKNTANPLIENKHLKRLTGEYFENEEEFRKRFLQIKNLELFNGVLMRNTEDSDLRIRTHVSLTKFVRLMVSFLLLIGTSYLLSTELVKKESFDSGDLTETDKKKVFLALKFNGTLFSKYGFVDDDDDAKEEGLDLVENVMSVNSIKNSLHLFSSNFEVLTSEINADIKELNSQLIEQDRTIFNLKTVMDYRKFMIDFTETESVVGPVLDDANNRMIIYRMMKNYSDSSAGEMDMQKYYKALVNEYPLRSDFAKEFTYSPFNPLNYYFGNGYGLELIKFNVELLESYKKENPYFNSKFKSLQNIKKSIKTLETVIGMEKVRGMVVYEDINDKLRKNSADVISNLKEAKELKRSILDKKDEYLVLLKLLNTKDVLSRRIVNRFIHIIYGTIQKNLGKARLDEIQDVFIKNYVDIVNDIIIDIKSKSGLDRKIYMTISRTQIDVSIGNILRKYIKNMKLSDRLPLITRLIFILRSLYATLASDVFGVDIGNKEEYLLQHSFILYFNEADYYHGLDIFNVINAATSLTILNCALLYITIKNMDLSNIYSIKNPLSVDMVKVFHNLDNAIGDSAYFEFLYCETMSLFFISYRSIYGNDFSHIKSISVTNNGRNYSVNKGEKMSLFRNFLIRIIVLKFKQIINKKAYMSQMIGESGDINFSIDEKDNYSLTITYLLKYLTDNPTVIIILNKLVDSLFDVSERDNRRYRPTYEFLTKTIFFDPKSSFVFMSKKKMLDEYKFEELFLYNNTIPPDTIQENHIFHLQQIRGKLNKFEKINSVENTYHYTQEDNVVDLFLLTILNYIEDRVYRINTDDFIKRLIKDKKTDAIKVIKEIFESGV